MQQISELANLEINELSSLSLKILNHLSGVLDHQVNNFLILSLFLCEKSLLNIVKSEKRRANFILGMSCGTGRIIAKPLLTH